nr:MAG TPA: hypothetical protein [Caudoviricetes sp.]
MNIVTERNAIIPLCYYAYPSSKHIKSEVNIYEI